MKPTLHLVLGVLMTTSTLAAYENQNTSKEVNKMGFFETLSVVKKVFFDSSLRIPKEKLPEVQPDFVSFLRPSETMKFIWFGHSTLLLNVENHIILVDPVFHRASPFSFLVNRFQAPVKNLDKLPAVDTIVISHDHYDHLDKLTVDFYKNAETTFLVPKGVGEHLKDWGIPASRIEELSWHESVKIKDTTFRATPAQHFSGRGMFDRNETLWASLGSLKEKQKKFTTAVIPDMGRTSRKSVISTVPLILPS
jgi:hypothetical protein